MLFLDYSFYPFLSWALYGVSLTSLKSCTETNHWFRLELRQKEVQECAHKTSVKGQK